MKPGIQYLAERTDLLPVLAGWFEAEWPSYYGPDGRGDADADLRMSAQRGALPTCLVAVGEEGAPLGTITLKAESFSHDDLGPWGAALLVAEPCRRRGIGTALVEALEEEARRLGFPKLYMATDAANALVERRGWAPIDTAESLRGTVTIYELCLSG